MYFSGSNQICDDRHATNLGQVSRRPLGLAINYDNNGLFIASAICGLSVVWSNGGGATTIAVSMNSVPFLVLYATDIDPRKENVYFTDAGVTFQERFITLIACISYLLIKL